MCVRTIVDASAFGHFCAKAPKSAAGQLRRWIGRGDGRIIYSAADTVYADELNKSTTVLDLLRSYYDCGRAIEIDSPRVKAALDRIPDRPIRKSNDHHILALAVAGEATVLFSCDSDLRKDFSNVTVLPRVGRQVIGVWMRSVRFMRP